MDEQPLQRVRIQPRAIEVPADDPFKYDLLDRKEFVEAFAATLAGIEGPAVFAVDGSWGTGKSTFCRMLAAHLRNQELCVVDINAWSTDYAQDPMAAFASQLVAATGGASETKRQFKEAAVKVLRIIAPGTIRLATAGLLDINTAVEGELGNALANAAADRLDSFDEDVQSMGEFRTRLRELAAEASDRPMVVTVDELDRCRPSYAVETLEMIKHLFDVDNVLFVLAVNRRQLDESVRILYGTQADPESYFRRFFDIEISLPPGDRVGLLRHALAGKSAQESDLQGNILFNFLAASDHSVRTLQHTVNHYHLVRSSFAEFPVHIWDSLLETALLLRVAVESEYRAFLRAETTDAALADRFFELPWAQPLRDTPEGALLESALMLASRPRSADGTIGFSPLHERYRHQSEAGTGVRTLKYYQELVARERRAGSLWPTVTQRIEMLDSGKR